MPTDVVPTPGPSCRFGNAFGPCPGETRKVNVVQVGHLYVCVPLPLFNLQSLARRSSEARTVCRRGGASLADRACGVTDLDHSHIAPFHPLAYHAGREQKCLQGVSYNTLVTPPSLLKSLQMRALCPPYPPIPPPCLFQGLCRTIHLTPLFCLFRGSDAGKDPLHPPPPWTSACHPLRWIGNQGQLRG